MSAVTQAILPDPIVIQKSPSGAVPFLTRFARRPDVNIPQDKKGNQSYLGVTSPGVGDYKNDDE